MADVATLSVLLVARDKLSGVLARNQKALQATGRAATAMGAVMVGVAALSVRAFANFEQALANAGAVSGATADQMKGMSEVAREMGRTTVFTATESAQALSFLAMAGFEVEAATKALPKVLQLAASAQIDLGKAADITTNVLAGYGFEVKDLAKVNDVLVKSFTSANTNLEQLGEAMKFAGPVASSAGVAFEETAAALSLMGNAGIQATMAGTALRGALARMLSPTKDVEDVMSKLGLTFKDSSGELLPLVDIIGQLETAGISAGDALKLFGLRAGPGMLALVSQGSDALAELTDELLNSGGTAETIAARQLDTLTGSLTLLKSSVESVGIEIGSILEPIIRSAAEKFANAARMVADFASEHPELAKVIVIAAAAVGGLLLVLGPLLIMLPGIVIAFGLAAGAATGFGVALAGIGTVAAGPVGLVIAAVALLTASLLPKFIGGLKDSKQAVEGLSGAMGGLNDVTREYARLLDDVGRADVELRLRDLQMALADINAEIAEQKIDTLGEAFKRLALGPSDAVDKLRERSSELAAQILELQGVLTESSAAWEEAIVGSAENAAAALAGLAEDTGTSLDKVTGRYEDSWKDITAIVQKNLDDQAMMNKNAFDVRRSNIKLALELERQLADETAVQAQREIDSRQRVTDSWQTFIQGLDPTMQRITDLNLSFADVVAQVAQRFGLSTEEMSNFLAEMGVNFGDTFALITKFGDDWLASFLSQLEGAKGAASGGGNQPRGSSDPDVQRKNRADADNIMRSISILTNRLQELQTPESRADLQKLIDELWAKLRAIPGFAHGVRNFAGGLAVVGERGPEIVRLPQGSDVIPNGGGMGGGAVTKVLNLTVNYLAPSFESKETVASIWRDVANAGGFADFIKE